MAVFADYDRVGAQDELQQFGFRQLAVIEHVPAGARSAAGLGAFQFDALKIKAAIVLQRRRIGRPLNIVFLVNVPMVALAADET